MLPPVELALLQPALPTKLSNRYPALRRLADRPLPITCLLGIAFPTDVHLTPPPPIHTCAPETLCVGLPNQLSGDYQAGASTAEGGFTGRIRHNREDRDKGIRWFEAMVNCYDKNLSEEEKDALHKWDREMIGGPEGLGTSDWPGWKKYIGEYPGPAKG
jgi:hypothetical protein